MDGPFQTFFVCDAWGTRRFRAEVGNILTPKSIIIEVMLKDARSWNVVNRFVHEVLQKKMDKERKRQTTFTETWLNNSFHNNELGFTRYNVYHCDRNEKTISLSRGGGVLIAIKNTFSSYLLNIDTLNVEQVFIKVLLNNLIIIICAVYIPPNSDVQLYLNHLSVIESLECTYPNNKFIVCGDYNIPSLTWVSGKTGLKCFNFISSTTGQSLIEGFSLLNFIQFNNIANSSGNILDLIFTSIHDTLIDPCIDPLVPIDSYYPVLLINCKLRIVTPNLNNDINICLYKSGD